MSIRRPEAPALQQQPSAPVGVVGAVRATGAVRHAQYTASGVQASRMPGTCLTTDVVMPKSKKPETATHANVTRIFEAQYNPETIAAFASGAELTHFALGDAKLHASHKATIGACAVTSTRAAECCVAKARNKCEHMDEAQTQGLSDHINRILERDDAPEETAGLYKLRGKAYDVLKSEVKSLIKKEQKRINDLVGTIAKMEANGENQGRIDNRKEEKDSADRLLAELKTIESFLEKNKDKDMKDRMKLGKADEARAMIKAWKEKRHKKAENEEYDKQRKDKTAKDANASIDRLRAMNGDPKKEPGSPAAADTEEDESKDDDDDEP